MSLPSWLTGSMLGPVLRDPFKLLVVQRRSQRSRMQPGVLRERFESIRDVDAKAVGMDRQPAVIEQSVHVTTHKQTTMLVVDAELGIAV